MATLSLETRPSQKGSSVKPEPIVKKNSVPIVIPDSPMQLEVETVTVETQLPVKSQQEPFQVPEGLTWAEQVEADPALVPGEDLSLVGLGMSNPPCYGPTPEAVDVGRVIPKATVTSSVSVEDPDITRITLVKSAKEVRKSPISISSNTEGSTTSNCPPPRPPSHQSTKKSVDKKKKNQKAYSGIAQSKN